jgi:hypothetical protein
MAALFLAQFILGGVLRAGLHNAQGGETELIVFSVIYVVLSLVSFYRARTVLLSLRRFTLGSKDTLRSGG